MSTSSQSPGQLDAGPRRILATLQAYRDAAALNTAIELELFTRIAHGADTASKLASEMEIPVRGIRVLCAYLAEAGFLEKEDEQLKLPADAATYLDKKSQTYLGGAGRILFSASLLRSFQTLTDTVRAGHASFPEEPALRTLPGWLSLARGVWDMGASAKAFAQRVELPREHPVKILEIGIQDGLYGIALAQEYPRSIVVAVDHTEALRVAQQNADRAGLGTRYQNISGDALVVPLGLEYDVVLLAGSLHRFDREQITSLFMRIQYALKKAGQLLVLEYLAGAKDDSHDAGFRLNMLAATPRGDVYSVTDVTGMLETSGFTIGAVEDCPEALATLVRAGL